MPASVLSTLQRFRAIEEQQRYSQLIDLYADDAVYFDPTLGIHRGRSEIERLLVDMEARVASRRARFTDWKIEAGQNCPGGSTTGFYRGTDERHGDNRTAT